MVSKGAQTEVDKVCLGPEGGRPIVVTRLDVRRIGVDEVLGET